MTVSTQRQVAGNFDSTLLPLVASDTELSKLGGKLKALWRADQGVTVDGSGKVSAWLDRVAGFSLAQADPSKRPAFLATGLAGGAAIQGDGIGAYLDGAQDASWPAGTSEGWLWLVLRGGDTDNATHSLFGYGGNNPATARRSMRRTDTGYPNIYCGASLIDNAHSVQLNHLFGAHFYNGGANINARYDGDAVAGMASAFNTGSTRVRMFASVDNTPANFSAAIVAQAFITSALTSDDLNRVETLGKWRAGILL